MKKWECCSINTLLASYRTPFSHTIIFIAQQEWGDCKPLFSSPIERKLTKHLQARFSAVSRGLQISQQKNSIYAGVSWCAVQLVILMMKPLSSRKNGKKNRKQCMRPRLRRVSQHKGRGSWFKKTSFRMKKYISDFISHGLSFSHKTYNIKACLGNIQIYIGPRDRPAN